MVSNQFFNKQGPFPLKKIISLTNSKNNYPKFGNIKINDIKNIFDAKKNDITFLSSSKYKEISLKTKAVACITTSNFSALLPEKCIKIYTKNVLYAVTQISRFFYPTADIDYPDKNLNDSKKIKRKYPKVFFGKNVLIGKNVSIGKNSYIGSNSIIESNVEIGKNCYIGSFVMIKNSKIFNDVLIQDGSKVGVKGFGFIPLPSKNLRTPHVGKVILHTGAELGANCTIDRGSMSDTVIGENTFLDNQVHVAHNVKIGKNCMIAGQVGFAGSSTLGNNVVIGGQAGVSGHLKIGNNVKIGGGSGVVNDLPDNSQVMGYPAIPLRDFVKLRRKE
tara:strand:+ start:58 stop:1053 length:996 start_codon:yes stop_codon:yes gene_type:complete